MHMQMHMHMRIDVDVRDHLADEIGAAFAQTLGPQYHAAKCLGILETKPGPVAQARRPQAAFTVCLGSIVLV